MQQEIGEKFVFVSIAKHFILSMILGLHDNSIVARKTGTTQTINLVTKTIMLTMKKKKSLQSCNSTVTKGFNHVKTMP